MSKRAPSPRAVLGTGASLLLLSAAAAGAAKAQELDGELLQLSAEFHNVHAEAGHQFHLSHLANEAGGDPQPAEDVGSALMVKEGEVWERMTAIPASTPEGLRAKAAVLMTYLPELNSDYDVSRLMASILRDILGRA